MKKLGLVLWTFATLVAGFILGFALYMAESSSHEYVVIVGGLSLLNALVLFVYSLVVFRRYRNAFPIFSAAVGYGITFFTVLPYSDQIGVDSLLMNGGPALYYLLFMSQVVIIPLGIFVLLFIRHFANR